MVPRLPAHLVCIACMAPFFVAPVHAQTPSSPIEVERNASAGEVVVLRNGEVLYGRVVRAAERVLVTLPGREISLRATEIDVVARSLADACWLKRQKIRPTDIDGRLDQAEWCMRHNLLAEAADELSAVASLQPFNTRLAALRRRHQKSFESTTLSQKPTDRDQPRSVETNLAQVASNSTHADSTAAEKPFSWPPKHEESLSTTTPPDRSSNKHAGPVDTSTATLERFMRSLPSQSVEQFTNSLQPMITRGCATAGCHAPGNSTDFTLLRLPQGQTASRRLTQRNLYNIVQLVDFSKPDESRLLKTASEPHGPLKSGVFGDRRSPKYRELRAWVSELTGTPLKGNASKIEQATFDAPPSRLDRASNPLFDAGPVSDVAPPDDPLEPNQPAQIKEAASSGTNRRPSRLSQGKAAKTHSRSSLQQTRQGKTPPSGD